MLNMAVNNYLLNFFKVTKTRVESKLTFDFDTTMDMLEHKLIRKNSIGWEVGTEDELRLKAIYMKLPVSGEYKSYESCMHKNENIKSIEEYLHIIHAFGMEKAVRVVKEDLKNKQKLTEYKIESLSDNILYLKYLIEKDSEILDKYLGILPYIIRKENNQEDVLIVADLDMVGNKEMVEEHEWNVVKSKEDGCFAYKVMEV